MLVSIFLSDMEMQSTLTALNTRGQGHSCQSKKQVLAVGNLSSGELCGPWASCFIVTVTCFVTSKNKCPFNHITFSTALLENLHVKTCISDFRWFDEIDDDGQNPPTPKVTKCGISVVSL